MHNGAGISARQSPRTGWRTHGAWHQVPHRPSDSWPGLQDKSHPPRRNDGATTTTLTTPSTNPDGEACRVERALHESSIANETSSKTGLFFCLDIVVFVTALNAPIPSDCPSPLVDKAQSCNRRLSTRDVASRPEREPSTKKLDPRSLPAPLCRRSANKSPGRPALAASVV